MIHRYHTHRVYIYDVFSIKPRLLAVFGPLENAPLCMAYCNKYDDHQDILLWGDDGGYVSTLIFNKRFFVDNVTEDKAAFVDPQMLIKRDMQEKFHMTFHKVDHSMLAQMQCAHETHTVLSYPLCAEKNPL